MNIFKVIYCRTYQQSLRILSKFLKWREPKVYSGEHAVDDICDILSKFHRFHPLLVTDPGVKKAGLDKKITAVLKKHKISYSTYSNVISNPTIGCVEEAYSLYKQDNCDCLIALGGGSSMDAAKAVAARIVNPRKDLPKFKGIIKVRKKMPLFIAIPTTAGTGSEATCACVIVNEKTNDKFAINDPVLIPHFAILDDSLLSTLPKDLIATTGMDALTHAIESFIGRSSSKKIRETALQSCALIKNNLLDFYNDPLNRTARINMQKAAYLAGVSFTRGYVGYVHALAHSLGGKYNVPHGLANAVLLPYLLEAYGKSAHKRLAMISDYLGLTSATSTTEIKAIALINWVKDLKINLSIPQKFVHIVKDEDFLELCTHAEKEANPLYPVPKELGVEDLEVVLLLACK